LRSVLVFIVTAIVAGSAWQLSSCSTIGAPTIDGPVVTVADGDTLIVLQDLRQIRIRLVENDDLPAPFAPTKAVNASHESVSALMDRKFSTYRNLIFTSEGAPRPYVRARLPRCAFASTTNDWRCEETTDDGNHHPDYEDFHDARLRPPYAEESMPRRRQQGLADCPA
jgi:hypothetical protein